MTCGLHSIRVDVDTERPFQGRVFVKGESYNKDCIKSFAGTPPAGAVPGPAPAPGPAYAPAPAPVAPGGYGETVGIELGFGQCNMRRQRTVSQVLDLRFHAKTWLLILLLAVSSRCRVHVHSCGLLPSSIYHKSGQGVSRPLLLHGN